MTWWFTVKWGLFRAAHRGLASVGMVGYFVVAMREAVVAWFKVERAALWAQYLRREKQRESAWAFDRWVKQFYENSLPDSRPAQRPRGKARR